MNVLVLMAGGSDAFAEAGYPYPKNLVEIHGLPLVERVIAGLKPLRDANRFVFMVPDEEQRQYHTGEVIRLLLPGAVVLSVRETAGAACTALLAVDELDRDQPLLIVNGDQIVEADLQAAVAGFQERDLDGGIIVFEAVHPRWSYVRCDETGLVVEAAEKRPISNLATAGIYYYGRASDFLDAAIAMIKKDAHVGGRFYICPTYNEMVLSQARIGVHKVPREAYFSLSNPRSVQDYEDELRIRSGRLPIGSAPGMG